MRVADDTVDPGGASTSADGEHPAKGPRRPLWPWLVGLGIVAALAVGVVAYERAGNRPDTLTPAQITSTVNSIVEKGIADAAGAPPASAIAYQAIQPSLVYIDASRTAASPEDATSGAGVVVDDQGQILTARHVVAGAEAIDVIFADGTRTTAQIVSEQADNDIAVLVADAVPSVIVPAVLGGGVRVG